MEKIPDTLEKVMKALFLNRAIRILLISNSIVLIAGYMLGPIYALFVERIGGDLMDASIAGGLFSLAAGLVTLVSGKYSDKLRRPEYVVMIGYTIMAVGFLLYLWVDSITFLFIVQVIIGMGEAIYSPAFDAVYSKHLALSRSGRQWGAWESMNYFTAFAGAIIGGLLVTRFSFDILFVVMAGLCLTSGVYILLLKRNLV